MKYSNSFDWANIPESRPADSYLSYADGSVFMDFSHEGNIIRLIRISFDGYGCCTLESPTIIPMDAEDSLHFLDMHSSGIIDQRSMEEIITRTIANNQSHIWNDALGEYHLLNSNS